MSLPNTRPASASKLASNLGEDEAPAKAAKMTRIVLDDSDNIPPTGQFFGVNGRNWYLRAGEEVSVPQGIIDILDNAVEKHPIKDGSNRVISYRNRHRFPYHVVNDDRRGRAIAQ
jgi:hypothetical protein